MKFKFLLLIILSNVILPLSAAEISAAEVGAGAQEKVSYEQQLFDILASENCPTNILFDPLKKIIIDYSTKFVLYKTKYEDVAVTSLVLLANGEIYANTYINRKSAQIENNDWWKTLDAINDANTVNNSTNMIYSILFLPNGNVITGHFNGEIQVRNIQLQLIQTIETNAIVSSLLSLPDGNLVSGHMNGEINFWKKVL